MRAEYREFSFQNMTESEFLSLGKTLSTEAKVLETLHSYFYAQSARIHKTLEHFDLFNRRLGDVLEIGPFFGYVPFALKDRAKSYTVLEGDDPVVYALKPLYETRGITMKLLDLFDIFGPTYNATQRLPFEDNSFDTVLCWETMEHFNFNPVKFAREVLRVLKPGGRVFVTVPNRASLQSLALLLLGRGEAHKMNGYFAFEDYESCGKKAFYGFHWNEYTPTEMRFLFERAGFQMDSIGTFVEMTRMDNAPVTRRAARLISRTVGGIIPRVGTNVAMIARKPEQTGK